MFRFFGPRARDPRKIDYTRLPASVSSGSVKDLCSADQARMAVLARSEGFVRAWEVNQALRELKVPCEAWAALRRLEKEGLVECRKGNDDPKKGEVTADAFKIAKKALNS